MQRIEELLLLVAERDDEKAFKEIFRHFFKGLFSFSSSIIGDRTLAEEAVGDVFAKLWENRKMLPTIKSLAHYLYIATKHASLNALQKQRKYKSISLDEAGEDFYFKFTSSDSNIISRESLGKINNAINDLPPRCRLIFRLIKEEGLRHAEVSQLLNVSVKTIEAQMTIALKKLTEELRNNMPEYHLYYCRKKAGNS